MTNYLAWIHPSLGSLHGAPLAVFILVLILTLAFILSYGIQGYCVWKQLRTAVIRLRLLKSKGTVPDPNEVAPIFRTEPLKHLWDEYADTLHKVVTASSGGVEIGEVRATIPAEAMFTRDVLVDSQLFDEFTRHLPGVLTGLGIIGTFAGLLTGLENFHPSSTQTAAAELDKLLQGVQHAFIASAFAIGSAMLVVTISKLVLAIFYGLVEQLSHLIDSLYKTGAGEEYLKRLVRASEGSELHSATLKDALVTDLKTILTNLSERQIEAHYSVAAQIGKHIEKQTQAQEEASNQLKEQLLGFQQDTTENNGEKVSHLMESLLTGFMTKLEETFGDQMQRSSQILLSVQDSMQELLTSIEKTNGKASSQMQDVLVKAIESASKNQDEMTAQMRLFVEEFRKSASDEQRKSKEAMDEAIASILNQVKETTELLKDSREKANLADEQRTKNLTNQVDSVVGGLSSQLDTLIATLSNQVSKTQENITQIGQITTSAIQGMNRGAESMGSAADRFESAGDKVSGVLETSSELARQMDGSARALSSASEAVRSGFEQYERSRRAVEEQVASLQQLVEAAKSQTGISKSLIDEMAANVEKVKAVHQESRQHLDEVNEALAAAFEKFGQQLLTQISSSIKLTDTHVAQSVGHLSAIVEDYTLAVQRLSKLKN